MAETVALNGTRRARTSSITLQQKAEVRLNGTRRARTSTLRIEVPFILALNGTRRARTSSLTLVSYPKIDLNGMRRARTSVLTLAAGGTIGLDATRERRTSNFQLDKPPVRLRRSAHFHVVNQGNLWVEKIMEMGPSAFYPASGRNTDVDTWDEFLTHDLARDFLDPDQYPYEGFAYAPLGPSTIPADPTGTSWFQDGDDYSPQYNVREHTLFPRTELLSFSLPEAFDPGAYLYLLESHGEIYVTTAANTAANPTDYSYVEFDGTEVPISLTIDDLAGGDHLASFSISETTMEFWLDGVQIASAPIDTTGIDYLYDYINPLWVNTGSYAIDDYVAFDRFLEGGEQLILWGAWNGEIVESEVSFALTRQRRTTLMQLLSSKSRGVVRWRLADTVTGAIWTMPINPDQMSSPVGRSKNLSLGNGRRKDSRRRTFQRSSPLQEWEWQGVIRSEAHYDALVEWAEKNVAVDVTDHLGRTFRVFITDFLPLERRPTRQTDWRLRYTMKTKILERIES